MTIDNRRHKVDGRLIVFEGPDGVGKSTVAARAAKWLNANESACELLSFPGNEPGTLGELVYKIHHAPGKFGLASLAPASVQALHIAAHLDVIEKRIIPALASGIHVLLDRYWWSTWVYGIAGSVERVVLKRMIDLERAFWGRLRPAAVILIRRDSPINRGDRLEDWERLSLEYGRLAAKETLHHPVFVVENNGTIEQAMTRVLEICTDVTSKRPVQIDLSSALRGFGKDSELHSETSAGSAAGLSTIGSGPAVLAHLLPAKPTVVFDTYWRFAAERQRVFFERVAQKPAPWTSDPIISLYKFTNAYRASDRVSQYLIRHVIYRDDLAASHNEVFFRILLFKVFNKVETWQLLERSLGPIAFEDYSFDAYDRILSAAMTGGSSIYSAAYIMPTGGKGSGESRKHRLHLRLIEKMMADELPQKIVEAKSMQRAFDLLLAYPTIGPFLAYQFATDLNYSLLLNFSEMDFVVPGPGALDGIRKCFADRGGLSESEIIKFVAENQAREFERLGLEFRSLWGRPLQLIDCQNLFCEVDKYARVMHPGVAGLSGRTRIKQRFNSNDQPIRYWYPPKWGINDKIGNID